MRKMKMVIIKEKIKGKDPNLLISYTHIYLYIFTCILEDFVFSLYLEYYEKLMAVYLYIHINMSKYIFFCMGAESRTK